MNEDFSSNDALSSEIPLKIKAIELTIADSARKYGFNRPVVHQATKGHGLRKIHSLLTILMQRKPSNIWPNRNIRLTIRYRKP